MYLKKNLHKKNSTNKNAPSQKSTPTTSPRPLPSLDDVVTPSISNVVGGGPALPSSPSNTRHQTGPLSLSVCVGRPGRAYPAIGPKYEFV